MKGLHSELDAEVNLPQTHMPSYRVKFRHKATIPLDKLYKNRDFVDYGNF